MVKPLGSRVMVKISKEDEVTQGGIVLPDTAKKKPNEGVVVAVGPGRLLENGKRAPMSLKAGDRVIFAEYAGTEFKIDGEPHVLVEDDQVLAVRE